MPTMKRYENTNPPIIGLTHLGIRREKKKLKEAVTPVLPRIPPSSKIVGRRYGVQIDATELCSYHEFLQRKRFGSYEKWLERQHRVRRQN